MSELHDPSQIARLEERIDEWLQVLAAADPTIEAVGRAGGDEIRWFVRMHGDEKDTTTLWLVLGQRTLRYETYVMPAPEEQHARLYEHLLRRNERLVGAHFSIGVEDAIFLRGELPLPAITSEEIDRIVGSLFEYVERNFRTMLRIGFASRFRDE